MKLYGIPNCNTVKKARHWLDQHRIEHHFHDFKKHGLEPQSAQAWLQQWGWEKLINRSGLTWRGIPDLHKQSIQDNTSALPLMLEKLSVIKRPLLERDHVLLYIGFDEAAYQKIFNL